MNRCRTSFFSFFFNSKALVAFVFFLSLLFYSSCKQQQKLPVTNARCILDFKNAKTLTSNLKLNEFNFDRMSAKLSVEALIDSTSESFIVSMRIKKDSIIWLSISKLGIEGARILISKDSVKFINRISNKYFKGDFAYISKMLNTDLDFEMLQSLLIGNSVEFYSEDEKIKAGVDNCQYTLGTIRKFKLRKVMEKGKELHEPAQSIYLLPKTFKIARIVFYDFNPARSLDARFGEYERIDSTQLFPMKIFYSIKAQNRIDIELNYNKISLKEIQGFPFKIPDNYEQILYKEKQR